jgi:hypothetical protein
MKTKSFLTSMLITFAITLVVTGVVTLLWNLIIDRSGANIDWKTSFMMAIILSIVLPFSRLKKE